MAPAKYEIRNTKYEIAAGEEVYMKYKIAAGKELLACKIRNKKTRNTKQQQVKKCRPAKYEIEKTAGKELLPGTLDVFSCSKLRPLQNMGANISEWRS